MENKTKPEESQNKPAELSDQDLDEVAGGGTLAGVTLPDKVEIRVGGGLGYPAIKSPGD